MPPVIVISHPWHMGEGMKHRAKTGEHCGTGIGGKAEFAVALKGCPLFSGAAEKHLECDHPSASSIAGLAMSMAGLLLAISIIISFCSAAC